jgi:hypothetical protein
MFVYLIRSSEGFCKIGISTDPKKKHLRNEWFKGIDVEDFKARANEFENDWTPFPVLPPIDLPKWRKHQRSNLLMVPRCEAWQQVWDEEGAEDRAEIARCVALREQGIEDQPYSGSGLQPQEAQ